MNNTERESEKTVAENVLQQMGISPEGDWHKGKLANSLCSTFLVQILYGCRGICGWHEVRAVNESDFERLRSDAALKL